MTLRVFTSDNRSMIIYFVYMVAIAVISNLGLNALESITFPEGRYLDDL